jgi:hypothetical protein
VERAVTTLFGTFADDRGGIAASSTFDGPLPQDNTYRWAEVLAVSPLSIRLDGDDEALPMVPDTLVGNLLVGDRVWCQLYGRLVVILGEAGGGPGGVAPIPYDPMQPEMVHQASGSQTITTGVWMKATWSSVKYESANARTVLGSSPNGIQTTKAGRYYCEATCHFPINSTAIRSIGIGMSWWNPGPTTPDGVQTSVASATSGISLSIASTLSAAVGDFITLWAFQNSGANLVLDKTQYKLLVRYLGYA